MSDPRPPAEPTYDPPAEPPPYPAPADRPAYPGPTGAPGGGTWFQPVQTPAPEPGPPWAIVVVAVLLGVVLGLLAGAFLFGGSPAASPTAGASPSPAPTAAGQLTPPPTASAPPTTSAAPGTGGPSASGSTPPASAPASLPADIAAQIDAVVGQVPRLRERDAERDVPYEIITREQFLADLQEMIADETEPELLAAEERALKRLGLLPPEMDLAAALEELYGSQIAAFYRPDTKSFYVIQRDAPFGALDRAIVAHEYTHALQDQHFDLEGTRITDPAETDAALAQLAVIEGDATLLMSLWMVEHLSFDELLEMFGQSLAPTDQEILDDMPPILRRQLEFPYADGLSFVSEIHGDGGWAAVDAALAEPPLSTEQILHPEKFRSGEEPIAIELADDSDALGAGWSVVYRQVYGELNLHVWAAGGEESPISLPGLPAALPHAVVAEGWGGDRMQMYEGPDGGWAIAWETAWDTQADADEFADRARDLQPTLDGVSSVVAVKRAGEADRVRVLVAHDQATLSTLFRALGN